MLRDLQPMMTAMRVAGVDPKPLLATDTAHLVAYGQDVVSLHLVARRARSSKKTMRDK